LCNANRRNNQNCNISYKRFLAGDCALLYNALFTDDWSPLYNESSVDAAVDRSNVAIMQAMNLAVLSGRILKHKYLACFSSRLKAYIRRKTISTNVTRTLRRTVSMTDFVFTGN
jgi:hypothetical protein